MPKPTVAIAALAVSLFAATQAYATPRISADVKTTPNVSLSAGESRAISIAAGRLLKHTADARLAIMNEDEKTALANVEKGLSLARIIETAAPSYTVKAKIVAGDTVYEDEETVKLRIVPIVDELDKVSLLAPLQHARSEAARKNKVVGEPVVADVSLHDTQVSLDTALAMAGLKAAKKKLEEGKLLEADLALGEVQESVFVSTVTDELPLDRAREDLLLARKNVDQGHLKKARADLDSAMASLKKFEATAAKVLADNSEALRDEIGDLSNVIEEEQEGATKKITAWWGRVDDMMKK